MFEKLFGNIGGKLKLLAKIYFTIASLFSVIGGVALLVSLTVSIGFGGFVVGLFVGAIFFALWALFAWLSTLALYAFGQLIENSDRTVKLLENAENARLAAEKAHVGQEQVGN